MFYNYPPGKAGIGASYLNVAESLANILQRLGREGYDVGEQELSADRVLDDITTKARNVGGYAPGELGALLEQGTAIRVSLREYTQWLDGYAPELKAKILSDWGPPDEVTLMAETGPGEPSLVIPAVQYGKVMVLPQPARGWGEDDEKLYHAKDLAPHHQYVATYAWLKHTYQADAVIHLGTHGTLEWLDGKDIGLSKPMRRTRSWPTCRISTSTTWMWWVRGLSRVVVEWRRWSTTWCRHSRKAGSCRSWRS